MKRISSAPTRCGVPKAERSIVRAQPYGIGQREAAIQIAAMRIKRMDAQLNTNKVL